MPSKYIQISEEAFLSERLKGARMMVWFRWAFISLLSTLVIIQYFSGYRAESMHAIRLLVIYLITNLFFTVAVTKKYDPAWVGYFGAVIDVGVLLFHLHYLSLYFDPISISAASTILLIPFMFLLYTFRLDRKLLIFVIAFGIVGFGTIYAYHFHLHPGIYNAQLSLSPVAQGFKSTYLLFLGLLCIYHQHSIYIFIEKQLEHLKNQADLTMQIRLEKQKSAHIKQLEILNASLEETIQKRTKELTEANTQLIKLQKENLQSQFEVLKQQVNPHFLFNSLNVLTSLIRIDPGLAERFTEQLSKVYRYVLENKDKDLVSLDTEMEFLEAYIFLLDIRFKDKVFIRNHFTGQGADGYVVPLALQLLIENAIKHNTFSKRKPLFIELSIDENNMLNIVNNLQNRETRMMSTGVGLANITKRYALLSMEQPSFEIVGEQFVARIPLIKNGKITDSN